MNKKDFVYNTDCCCSTDREISQILMEQNQELKERWKKLKEFVNMPKEIQQSDERFEVTVDSIKAKMQELEPDDLIRRKEK